MSKLEALIFDLDGTLWDAIDCCVSAWNAVLENQGKLTRVARSDFLASMGKNHKEICEFYFTDLPMDKREVLIRGCYAQEVPQIRTTPPKLYPEVSVGLKNLKNKYRLAIVSNCQRPYLDAFIEVHGFEDLFESTLCYQDSGLAKAQNIINILDKMSVQPSASFYIGDTIGDQKAAMQSEVPFGYAAYAFGEATDYEVLFESFQSITNYFLKPT